MNKPPAFQFYADDFLSGTADMTAEEVGVYIRLLCHAWTKDGLEDNDRLALMAGQCQASSLAHAKTKFRLIGGRLRNDRQEAERQKQAEFRQKQAENGKKRWVGNAKPVPSHMPNVCSPSPSPSLERESEFPECPPMSRKDFDELVQVRGIPTDCANWFWNTNDARNWLDSKGQPIRKVEPLLMNAVVSWRKMTVKKPNGKPFVPLSERPTGGNL